MGAGNELVESMVKFSLVLATINRVREVDNFLQSLTRQTYQNFELIVVDQNVDNRVEELLERSRSDIEILHLRSEPGLSRARNRGLEFVRGDIVAFPDDDCWYPTDLLEKVASYFERHEIDIATGQSRDADNRHSQRLWPSRPCQANKISIWRLAISYTVFARAACVRQIGGFDESLGVGADSPWQSGEETDYLLRAIDCGFTVHYFPDLWVFHPQKTQVYDAATIERARVYGAGLGRVLNKHSYPAWYTLYMFVRPLGGIVLSLITLRRGKACYHAGVLRGRLRGWAGS